MNSLELRVHLSNGCPTDVAVVVVVAHPDPEPLRTCGSYFWTESLWRFN